mmetsp:Transcript_54751/g.152809  ORF Transcript_54751/g.152809 Transcript_54751/m.152809 type:complete len:387 (+) Transcript_54751:157-1317(+)
MRVVAEATQTTPDQHFRAHAGPWRRRLPGPDLLLSRLLRRGDHPRSDLLFLHMLRRRDLLCPDVLYLRLPRRVDHYWCRSRLRGFDLFFRFRIGAGRADANARAINAVLRSSARVVARSLAQFDVLSASNADSRSSIPLGGFRCAFRVHGPIDTNSFLRHAFRLLVQGVPISSYFDFGISRLEPAIAQPSDTPRFFLAPGSLYGGLEFASGAVWGLERELKAPIGSVLELDRLVRHTVCWSVLQLLLDECVFGGPLHDRPGLAQFALVPPLFGNILECLLGLLNKHQDVVTFRLVPPACDLFVWPVPHLLRLVHLPFPSQIRRRHFPLRRDMRVTCFRIVERVADLPPPLRRRVEQEPFMSDEFFVGGMVVESLVAQRVNPIDRKI